MERDSLIVAGFGYRRDASADSLRAALAACGRAPHRLATVAGKDCSIALRELAEELGLDIVAIPKSQLVSEQTATQSPAASRTYGTGSVAEAAALAAAGPGARLIIARQISPDRMATCAMAEGDRV
ncbi:cobalamin biosynthesis protein [Roseovarius sp. D0-M9]|uniref:cobalamin biosynthesis protein n=1 Tax=Roseovarius sp. D0-M9 TaxID=3127117 RepID=UPI00300FE510